MHAPDKAPRNSGQVSRAAEPPQLHTVHAYSTILSLSLPPHVYVIPARTNMHNAHQQIPSIPFISPSLMHTCMVQTTTCF